MAKSKDKGKAKDAPKEKAKDKPKRDPKAEKAKAKAEKAKAKAREEEADDGDEGEYEEPPSKKPKNDVYVGLGAITLVAFIVAAVLFYLDGEAHKTPPPQANVTLNGIQLSGRAPQQAP